MPEFPGIGGDRVTVKIVARIDGRTSIGDRAINALIKKLKKEGVTRRACAHKVLNKYALLIQGTARKNLNKKPKRIDEGTLRASVQTFVSQLFTIRLAAMVFTDLEYAAYVHWGTGIHGESPEGGHRQTPWVYYDEKRKIFVFTQGMMPNPYLLDAFNTHHKPFLRELEKCLKEP